MLIKPPQDSLSAIISGYLAQASSFSNFRFAVAWARQRGVELIASALKKYSGHSVGIIGLNQRGTSYEALYALYELLDELWVFYKHRFQTFHPKMYFFLPNPNNENQKAVTVIGSSNLTSGGLDSNFEVNWLQELDLNVTMDQATLDEIQRYFQDLINCPFCHYVDSTDFLNKLLAEKYISLEKSIRAETSRSMQRGTRRPTGVFLPEAPPPQIKGYYPIDVPIPSLPETESIANKIVPPEETTEVEETLFYVRTLTQNDVLKALRQRSGTWEMDLGLTARNVHPQFWGWPDKYTLVLGSNRMEWHTQAVYYSRLLPEGMVESLRLWFRPERSGHAAEHRFRPAASIRDYVISPNFNTQSLMVVQRTSEDSDVAFRVEFILPEDPGYENYSRYLTIERPQHKFGYSSISDIED